MKGNHAPFTLAPIRRAIAQADQSAISIVSFQIPPICQGNTTLIRLIVTVRLLRTA